MKLLKFSAVWCPACLVMNPIWDEIKKQYPEIELIEYDYDINEAEVNEWNVGSVLPVTIFLDQSGFELTRLVGEQKKSTLEETIDVYKDM